MTANKRETLYNVAMQANIRVPLNHQTSNWDSYPHYELFCATQLHSPVPHEDALLANAKLIATIPHDDVDLMTKSKLLKMGFIVGGKV